MIKSYYNYRVEKLISAITNYSNYKFSHEEDINEEKNHKLKICIEDLKLQIFKSLFWRWIK